MKISRYFTCLLFLIGVLFGYEGQALSGDSSKISKVGESSICSAHTGAELFSQLNMAYMKGDGKLYQDCLKHGLYEAHRLHPEACVLRQRDLLKVGSSRGFDGMESLWLIYQDCASITTDKQLISMRSENARLFGKGLRFKADPAMHIQIRVSRWNSLIERGVRGEALRVLLQEFAAADPEIAQAWSHDKLLSHASVKQGLCQLEPRRTKTWEVALTDLIRNGQCLTGIEPNVNELCGALGRGNGSKISVRSSTEITTALEKMEVEDRERLIDFCDRFSGGGGAGSVGIDSLDMFSTDMCIAEGPSRLSETGKVTELFVGCYLEGESNPFASGRPGSGDLGKEEYRGVVIHYRTGQHVYNASVTIGPGKEGEHYHGLGSTPEEAADDLASKLEIDGYEVNEENGTYTATRTNEYENEDGSTSRVVEHITWNADGSSSTSRETHYPDGSRVEEQTNSNADGTSSRNRETHNPDGSHELDRTTTNSDGSSRRIEWTTDSDGNIKTQTITETDAEGNTTTTTTNNEHDEEGTIVGQTVTVTKNGETTTTQYDSDGNATTTNKLPDGERGFDPHNPACQELMRLQVVGTTGDSPFWDALFDRKSWVDPRKVKPRPNKGDSRQNQEPFCGAGGVGNNNEPTKCNLPIMCQPDEYLDDSCNCIKQNKDSVALRGCMMVNCSPEQTPVPVGMNMCICVGENDSGGDSGPPGNPNGPGPDPISIEKFGVAGPFGELLWNHHGDGINAIPKLQERPDTPFLNK